eukprot:TRINITY_DN7348_c0_g1_i7.p1 TRINITY_DN7348_c0_g1~~TRINITY_DN7348_c0_g1_i7.p1  ORF type:complete len:198 (-),score=8.73 TRINITY_DN7348_c0_g1_i7:198-791(-)
MHPTHSVGSNPLSAFRRNLPLASKTSSHKPFLGRANSKMEIKANEYAQNSLPSIVLNKLVMVENGNAVVERQRPAAKLKILQMRRMRKINRLFNTIRNISLLSNKSNDSSYYINPVDVTESKRRRALKSLRANKALENARKTTLAHTKDNLKKTSKQRLKLLARRRCFRKAKISTGKHADNVSVFKVLQVPAPAQCF